jgi:hypothetical protein
MSQGQREVVQTAGGITTPVRGTVIGCTREVELKRKPREPNHHAACLAKWWESTLVAPCAGYSRMNIRLHFGDG